MKIVKIIIKKIKRFARILRICWFKLFDLVGETIFFFMRLLCIIPKIEPFKRDNIKKILIIRMDRIGDLILSTPAIRTVKKTFPDAEISLLVRKYTKDLVLNNHFVDRLLIYEEDKIDKDYDLCIVLHPKVRQNRIAFISGARYRIGYVSEGGGFYLTHKIFDDRETRVRHEVESALEVVKSIGCVPDNDRLDISITDEGEKYAGKFFQKERISAGELVAVIHPGARQYHIRWKKEGFAEVADNLVEKYKAKVIIIGGREESELAEEIISLTKNKPIRAIGLRLTELISIIKKCNLFIGNSSGPMHIADVLNVPVVAIFGNIHPLDSYQEWGPRGSRHIVVSKNLRCPNCHPGDCTEFKCMKLITTEDVLQAVKELIG